MTDIRQKFTTVKCKRNESTAKRSLFMRLLLFHEIAASLCLTKSIDEEKFNFRTTLPLEFHDYQINYVSTDLRRQNGISMVFMIRRRDGSGNVA